MDEYNTRVTINLLNGSTIIADLTNETHFKLNDGTLVLFMHSSIFIESEDEHTLADRVLRPPNTTQWETFLSYTRLIYPLDNIEDIEVKVLKKKEK